MAVAKTGVFTIDETIILPTTATRVEAEIDLGAYVDPGDNQALEVTRVDFIFQSENGSNVVNTWLGQSFTGGGSVTAQLVSTNPSALVFADDESLIASGNVCCHASNFTQGIGSDLYPDQFGKPGSGYHLVNQAIWLQAQAYGGYAGANNPVATVRIHCRIVKLATKDWMAIALERSQD